MGSPSGDSGKEGRFDNMIMAAVGAGAGVQQRKSSSSGRVDMVSKIDLSVKLDEDEEMESLALHLDEDHVQQEPRGYLTAVVKDEEASSPQPEFQAPAQRSFGGTFKRERPGSSQFEERAALDGMKGTGSDRSTVEDEESPPSSPAALSQLQNEVTRLS